MLIALAVRAGAFVVGGSADCVADECAYLVLADRLLLGEGVQAYRGHLWAPGYIGFLAGHGAVGLDVASAAKVTQVFLGAASVLLLGIICDRAFGRRIALASAWLFALYPTLVAYTHYLWAETLYLLLLIAAVGASLEIPRATRRGGNTWSLIAGCLWGLSALVKPLALYFSPIALFLVSRASMPEGKGGRTTAVLIGLGLVVLPWITYASSAFQRTVVIEATAGKNLWRGNNPMPPFNADLGTVRVESADPDACTHANPVDRDRCDGRRALAWIAENPGHALARVPGKLADLWAPTSFLLRHVAWGAYGEVPTWLAAGLWASTTMAYAVVVVGSIIGFALPTAELGPEARLFRRVVLVFVLFTFAAHAVTFGMSRFRLPVMPFLIPFAGIAFVERARWLELLGSPARLVAVLSGILLFASAWVGRIPDSGLR